MLLWSASAIFEQSTFSSNAAEYGAAIRSTSNSGITVKRSTVFQNLVTDFSTLSGGAIDARSALIDHSIVAGTVYRRQDGSELSRPDIRGSGYSVSHSIVQHPGDLIPTILNGDLVSVGNAPGTAPGLAPLAMNGSGLPTHALLPHSIAIDAGDPSITAEGEHDQRGAPTRVWPTVGVASSGSISAPTRLKGP